MYDRVKVTSSTTGTGTLTLDSGAAVGFRSFYAVSPSTSIVVPYLITGGSAWELGFGTYNGANPGTLTRDEVIASSNSNAAVNFSAGTKEVSIAPHTTTALAPGARHNWLGLAEPTATDDSSLGYAEGSMWRFGSRWWYCSSPAAAAAVWIEMSTNWRYVPASGTRAEIDADDAETDPSPRSEFCVSMFSPPGSSTYNRRHAQLKGPGRQTTGTTPDTMEVSTPSGAAGVFRGTLLAVIVSGSNQNKARAWDLSIVWRNAGGTATLIGSPSPTAINGDSELSAATAVISASGADIVITITGVTGETVDWSLMGQMNEAFA